MAPSAIVQFEWAAIQAAITDPQASLIGEGGQACVYTSRLKFPRRDLLVAVALKVYKESDVFIPLDGFRAEVCPLMGSCGSLIVSIPSVRLLRLVDSVTTALFRFWERVPVLITSPSVSCLNKCGQSVCPSVVTPIHSLHP